MIVKLKMGKKAAAAFFGLLPSQTNLEEILSEITPKFPLLIMHDGTNIYYSMKFNFGNRKAYLDIVECLEEIAGSEINLESRSDRENTYFFCRLRVLSNNEQLLNTIFNGVIVAGKLKNMQSVLWMPHYKEINERLKEDLETYIF